MKSKKKDWIDTPIGKSWKYSMRQWLSAPFPKPKWH